jgi:D-3-phosphoglycerate dehydrogenase / 2-oxoglutarate reductase
MAREQLVLFTDADHTIDAAVHDKLLKLQTRVHQVETREEFVQAARESIAVLNSGFSITADLIGHLDRCRVISRFGSGYDNIDVGAATRKGIPVCNVPVFCVEEVATRAMTLLLACSCQLLRLDRTARSGVWGVQNLPYAEEVDGQVLGLVGFGKIGRAVASRAKPFGFRVIAFDPYVSRHAIESDGVEAFDLDDLLATSDYVSVHSPLNSETRHLLDRRRLGLLKPSSFLVNTSRGGLVDEAALIECLSSGRLAGAGLDVFEKEPPDRKNPLFALDNVILTPHCAAHTVGATQRVRQGAIDNIIRALEGEPLKNVVNPDYAALHSRSLI